jgi:hypothetical protein
MRSMVEGYQPLAMSDRPLRPGHPSVRPAACHLPFQGRKQMNVDPP